MIDDDFKNSVQAATDSVLGTSPSGGYLTAQPGRGTAGGYTGAAGATPLQEISTLGLGVKPPAAQATRHYGMPSAESMADEYAFGLKGAQQDLTRIASQTPVTAPDGTGPVAPLPLPPRDAVGRGVDSALSFLGRSADATGGYLLDSAGEIADEYKDDRLRGVVRKGWGDFRERAGQYVGALAGIWSREAGEATDKWLSGDGDEAPVEGADALATPTPGLGLGFNAVLAGAQAAPAAGTTPAARDAKYFKGDNRAKALAYAKEQGFAGTEDEQIQQAVDAKRAMYEARDAAAGRRNVDIEALVDRYATPIEEITQHLKDYEAEHGTMQGAMAGVRTREQVRKQILEGLQTSQRGPATPGMDYYIAQNQALKSQVASGAISPQEYSYRQGQIQNNIRGGQYASNGGLTGAAPAGVPNGAQRLAKLASADPSRLNTSGDKFAYETATTLNNMIQQAGSFGNLTPALQKQADRLGEALEGMRGVSAGSKRTSALKRDLTSFQKALEVHAGASKNKLATRGEVQKQQIAKSTAALNQWYKVNGLKMMAASKTKSSVSGKMTESQILTKMSEMEENATVDLDAFRKKMATAQALFETGELKDVRKHTWTPDELKYLDYYERAQTYTK